MKKFLFVALFSVVVFTSLSVTSAFARVAQGVWLTNIPEDVEYEVPPLTSLAQARAAAFGQAVTDEAVDILAGKIDAGRLSLLHEFLTPRADSFIVSYSELGIEDVAGGKQLTVDVAVNRDLLKRQVKRLGIWYTLEHSFEYNPVYGTMLPETWENLGRLHVLYGLTPNSEAPVSLQMSYAEEIWSLVLQRQDGADIVAQGATLDDAWHSVWGRYFSGTTAGDTTGETVLLQVAGWFTPDGVEAFDRMLQEWTKVLDTASLTRVEMKPVGIGAHWHIVVTDKAALETRLREYLAGRGLTFALAAAL